MIKIDMKDKRVRFCFELAFKDATLRAAYINKSELDVLKQRVFDSFSEYMKKESGLLKDINEFINKVYDDCNSKFEDFSYGNAQKVVNMFLKYIYNATIFSKTLEVDFKECHCPIDSIMIDKLIVAIESEKHHNLLEKFKSQDVLNIARYKKGENKGRIKEINKRKYFEDIVWSRMNQMQYNMIQSLMNAWAIDENCTQLELDYKYWLHDELNDDL